MQASLKAARLKNHSNRQSGQAIMMKIDRAVLASLLAIVLLTACSDEQLDDIQTDIDNNLYPDKDYSSVITFPTTNNTACPNWQANSTITLRESLSLPANCTFQQVTVLIDRPNVELNCNQAVFNGLTTVARNKYGKAYTPATAPTRYGIIVKGAEAGVRVSNVTIRNCQLLNYSDAITAHIELKQNTLLGLRNGTIQESTIQAIAPTRINVFNSRIINSHMHGIFLNRYITHLNVNNTRILGSSNSGIYLGADTEYALIENSVFEGNGFSNYDTETLKRFPRRDETSRREAIAVDASSHNQISHNTFRDNGDGGVYLYKNCWEFEEEPLTAPHRYGSNSNLITNNDFSAEETAIWVAERADRNLADFTCGDPLIYTANSNKYYRDIAQNNIISNNKINHNKFGIRVQDNGTVITNNSFIGTKSGPDIWVYSVVRQAINDPVNTTTIRDNTLSKPNNILYENGAS